MAGAIGVAHSATGKKAWDRFGNMFQAGYIAGFLDCVRIAKGLDSQGYVATNYILPRGARPGDYQRWINEQYKNPDSAERTLPQMLVLAGHAMEAQFGPDQAIGSTQMQHMRKIIDLRRQKALEESKTAAGEAKAGEAAGDTKSGEEAGGVKSGEAAGAAPTPAPATPSGATPPAEAPAAK